MRKPRSPSELSRASALGRCAHPKMICVFPSSPLPMYLSPPIVPIPFTVAWQDFGPLPDSSGNFLLFGLLDRDSHSAPLNGRPVPISLLVRVYAQLTLALRVRGLLDTDILTPYQAEDRAQVCFTPFCLFKINWPGPAATKLSYFKCITHGDRYAIHHARPGSAFSSWLLCTAVLSLLTARVSPERGAELGQL